MRDTTRFYPIDEELQMAVDRLKIKKKNGVYYLTGVLDEFVDLSPLQGAEEPMALNMRGVKRCNSIGIRSLLKFLMEWGDKPFSYYECPSEFVYQLSVVKGLRGPKNQGKVRSVFVPFECPSCQNEESFLKEVSDFSDVTNGKLTQTEPCPKCGATMEVIPDWFAFGMDKEP